jgi:phenylpyruvate tautomerase PptA (4-oxalocrotonate tautomerase family)
MPKIVIKTLPMEGEPDIPGVLHRLGRDISQATDIPEERLVILWEFIRPGHFLFNGETALAQPAVTHHPIVEIAVLEGMARETIETLVRVLTRSLSQRINLEPENICVILLPIPLGNLYVGGEFRSRT